MKTMKRNKKLIISLCVVLAVIALLVLLSFTLFSLKEIEIDYRTSKNNITLTDKEIIKSGKFKGGSVFFHGKKGYIENIEKNNPYIKVINIETVFPSKFVIHIAERQEVYAIEGTDCSYICDEELKVLRIDEDYQNTPQSPIKLQLEEVLTKDYKVGDYITGVRKPKIYQGLFENNYMLGDQQSLIESVTLSRQVDSNINKEQTVSSIKLFSGQTFKIVNDSYGLKYKLKLMVDVFSQMYDFIGKEIKIKTFDGEKEVEKVVTLHEEDIKTATFEIRNYYNYRDYGVKDCYFDFLIES